MSTGRPMPSGIVLAGGAGRRMGRPKGPLLLDGRPLAAIAGEILSVMCDYVVVVTRPEIPLPAIPSSLRTIYDQAGPDAPLTGIVTGLAAVPRGDVLVLACDMPTAGPAVAALAAAPAGRAVVATAAGRVQPLCARYPRCEALAAGLALLGSDETRAIALADALGAEPVAVPASALANLNTPADLAAVSWTA